MKPNGWILNAIIASMLITGAVSAMEDLEIKCEGSKRPALVAAIPAGKSSEPAEILSSSGQKKTSTKNGSGAASSPRTAEDSINYTVCITGATRGIGLEFVKQYAEAGWEVLACSRHPETPALQALKSKHTNNVFILELDVCNENQIERLVNHLKDKPIDLLINSAGIYGNDYADQAFYTVNSEAMLEVFKVNAIAPLMVSRSLLNNLVKSRLKMIVTITSCAGSISDNTSGGTYAYRASKAAVNMVVKSLAVDLKPREIKVFLLHPGWVKTDMGGSDALIDAESSIKGMRHVIEEQIRNPIDTENIFFNYQGQILPW